jgi:oligopeptide transport system permease protein
MLATTPDEIAIRPAKGVSLGQDAWRRLRRNRRAMASLVTLIAIGLLAFLTPFLPLQPPDDDNTKLQYQPPRFWPLFVASFRFDWEAIQRSPERLAQARRELDELIDQLAAARQTAGAESVAAVDKAVDGVQRKTRELEDVVLRPYTDAGFADLGPLSRWMVRMRYRLFGNWSLGPVAGRDEFGRDVLSRVFWGARISIIVGIVATLVSLSIGVTYGAVAGYVGGWVDDVMMRIVDILYSIPFIFIVIFLITVLSDDQI